MAEGGVQQPSAVPPTAASDTAPPSSMLTSNSLRLSSTAPFSGAPPGRILAAAGKHAGKYAWRKRKICQRDGPETPETPPKSAASTPALSARSRRRICSPERKRSQPPDGNLRVARLSLPLRGRRRFCRWPGGPPAPQLHPPSRRASSSCSTKSCLGAAQRRLRDSPAAPRGSTRGSRLVRRRSGRQTRESRRGGCAYSVRRYRSQNPGASFAARTLICVRWRSGRHSQQEAKGTPNLILTGSRDR